MINAWDFNFFLFTVLGIIGLIRFIFKCAELNHYYSIALNKILDQAATFIIILMAVNLVFIAIVELIL